jgi:FKBP-type peptidyl-prolyl cis-trans isomerase 2
LLRNKRLTGKTLEFALTVVDEDSEIGEKLKAGKALTEYELHLMIDVWLVHMRVA